MVGEEIIYYDWQNPGLRVVVEFFIFGFAI
jgi:hypothetical protein